MHQKMKEITLQNLDKMLSSSEKVAQWNPGELSGSFMQEIETLYKTEEGTYFLHTHGGLFSRFQPSEDSGSWFGGAVIRPMSEEEAFAWCRETGNYEVIDRCFFHLKILS